MSWVVGSLVPERVHGAVVGSRSSKPGEERKRLKVGRCYEGHKTRPVILVEEDMASVRRGSLQPEEEGLLEARTDHRVAGRCCSGRDSGTCVLNPVLFE